MGLEKAGEALLTATTLFIGEELEMPLKSPESLMGRRINAELYGLDEERWD
jgi:hypothetical protein